MTRRELRKAFNHAFACWLKYRTRKWEAELKRLNLALMQLSVKEAQQ